MAVKRGSGRGSEYIVVSVGVGDKVKRVPRRVAEAYFRGEPAGRDAESVFFSAFLRSAENHPDPRVRGQYEQVRAALSEERHE